MDAQNDERNSLRTIIVPYFDEETLKFDGWCGVVLEMDVWGFGSTVDEAEADLLELFGSQVEFATGHKIAECLDHPAEEKWFRLWDILQRHSDKNDEKSKIQDILIGNLFDTDRTGVENVPVFPEGLRYSYLDSFGKAA